jgi:hypothetical protein
MLPHMGHTVASVTGTHPTIPQTTVRQATEAADLIPGLSYQKLVDFYLLDCAKKRKKLTMKRVA